MKTAHPLRSPFDFHAIEMSRRRWFWLRKVTAILASTLIFAFAVRANAQTYSITDVSAPGANPSFATGVNASGQVSGCSAGRCVRGDD